jgi:hypothetical protein
MLKNVLSVKKDIHNMLNVSLGKERAKIVYVTGNLEVFTNAILKDVCIEHD